MKKVLFLLCFVLLFSGSLYASGALTEESSEIVINFGTFAGMVAVISALVTQLAKVFSFVSGSKIRKILTSVVAGMVVILTAWVLHIAPFMEGLPWWQVVLYGIAGGLSGCGFYDIIAAIGKLFKNE